jgi:hypothetical protein
LVPCRAAKSLDLEVLLDIFEEKFGLPAATAELSRFQGRQIHAQIAEKYFWSLPWSWYCPQRSGPGYLACSSALGRLDDPINPARSGVRAFRLFVTSPAELVQAGDQTILRVEKLYFIGNGLGNTVK